MVQVYIYSSSNCWQLNIVSSCSCNTNILEAIFQRLTFHQIAYRDMRPLVQLFVNTLRSLTFSCSLHIKPAFYKDGFINSPTPLLFRIDSYVLRIGMTCPIHVSTLTSNYVSIAINLHSSRIPGINGFQIVDYNCNLIILQYICIQQI